MAAPANVAIDTSFQHEIDISYQAGIDKLFQQNIDSAFQDIMLTHTGKAICQEILGAQPDALEFHLGVSHDAAVAIAQNCSGAPTSDWIYPTSYKDIRKLTLKGYKGRRYSILRAQTKFPIESWTDPFTNTTVLLADRNGISHERLVQLLAHELAVYFDSKANPAHPNAQNIPTLKNLRANVHGNFDPLVAISDPQVAHTLTYVRALQVEYSIVNELIAMGKIQPPADHDRPALKYLISDACQQDCLQRLVVDLRQDYLPIGLPLLAFAPYFRALVGPELQRSGSLQPADWSVAQQVLTALPVSFLSTQFTGDPAADLQRVFVSDDASKPAFQTVATFLNDKLWPLEQPVVMGTALPDGTPLLQYMKTPLLSGYNISLSSGPRVRIGTGNVE